MIKMSPEQIRQIQAAEKVATRLAKMCNEIKENKRDYLDELREIVGMPRKEFSKLISSEHRKFLREWSKNRPFLELRRFAREIGGRVEVALVRDGKRVVLPI